MRPTLWFVMACPAAIPLNATIEEATEYDEQGMFTTLRQFRSSLLLLGALRTTTSVQLKIPCLFLIASEKLPPLIRYRWLLGVAQR